MQLFCFLLKQFFENVKKKFTVGGFREGRSGYSKHNFFFFASLKLGIQHRALEYYYVCSNNDPVLTFDFFLWQGQIWSLMLLYGKKVKKWIFRNYCSL